MLNLKPFELFKFATEVFGNEAMFFMLKGELPDKMADEDLTQLNLEIYIDKMVNEPEMAKIIRAFVTPRVSEKLRRMSVCKSSNFEDRLNILKKTFNLTPDSDEADELLNTHEIFYFGQSVEKSFINNLLETHNKKIIWITNRYENIHASTMRRFAFSLEFKDFSSKNRLKVLRSELKRNKLEAYFTEEELKELCDRYAVNAGSIINAMNLLKIRKKTDKAASMQQLHTVLKNQEKALSIKKNNSANKKDFTGYSLEGLNCSLKPDELIASLKKYLEIKESNQLQSERPFSMLLYGLPGTGKSEFIYYLGSLLEKEVLLKRASEITSKWVGETEKNLAAAFEEGQEKEGILFFDEADSFLFPRKQAQRSWEISATNEILTQLEAYKGIVAFATNDIQGLDHASLRRFRYKVEFRPLTPEGNLHFYNTVLGPLITGQKELASDELKRIQAMNNLTPGDFAVVKDQFMYSEPSGITPHGLIDSLLNEVKHKQEGRKIAGFGG